ncbi:von willebrand factor type a domain protein [Gigaspora margarita]|uniref:von willebrand factor type a domain protein n=1 Tax=Gigaspora margarita TaxID=4874 RepID=A0A8H3XDD9_GIGMA|nr:von willebrand factor type a domain protein [Gigaspora margarita]
MNLSKVLGGNAEDYLSENEFALLIAELQQFNRRANIFYASYCENEIETLQDKTLLKTSEDSHNYQSLGEIYHSVESEQINIQRKEIKQKIEDLDITVHDFWREFVILSQIIRSDGSSVLKKLYDIDDKQLEKAYNVWIREGEAIQILEGVLLRTLNSDFLSSVLSKIMSNSKWQLIVISVIGLESSGKSKLLNYLFQCGFSTSAGRCTKGAYMSYRHTIYKEKELDILNIDSEGMGSTAAKYISRHTDFDKKMTLLEVSSYHLDALSNRDSKPRISFVLRDMKDAKRAQHLAFLDIRDSLKRMFNEIPANAFACSFDNFYPQSMISDGEKFHYPAETFPLTISKLRKELLDSALIPSENHESQIFKNVHGFIMHMQTVWKEIDAREKISNQYELQIIEEGETHIKAAFAAKKQELKIGDKVREILKNHKNKTPKQYKRIFSKSKCDELFDDEWKKVEKDKENFMNTLAMKEKTLEQHVVNSFNHAVESGRAISNDDRDLKERLKFNRRFWNKITIPATLNTVSLDDKLFFDSIKISRANIFNPSNLATYIGIDDDKKKSFKGEVIDRIKTEIKGTCERICDDLLSRNALAIEFSQALEWLKSLCKNIFIIQSEINQLQSHFKVEIEDFSTMEQYLRLEVFVTLKNNTAKWKDSQLNNLENLRESLLKYFHEILNNSSFENISIHFLKCIDKSIKEQLFIQEQKISELLETHLKKNWKSEKKNPTRYAYEQSFGTYDVGKTRKYIDNPTSFMRELFENDIDTFKNIKVDEVLEDIEKTIYYTLEKLGKNISILQQKLQINSSFTIEEIFQKIDAENNRINSQKISYKDLIEDAIRVLGKCTIDSPQDFCAILKEDHNKFLLDFKKLWKNDYTNHKQSMIYKVECSKQSYWNKVEENMKKNHPKWWTLLGRKQPDDDQIKQVRAMWVHLKTELCNKYNMVDKTPENWQRDYGHLAKNH